MLHTMRSERTVACSMSGEWMLLAVSWTDCVALCTLHWVVWLGLLYKNNRQILVDFCLVWCYNMFLS